MSQQIIGASLMALVAILILLHGRKRWNTRYIRGERTEGTCPWCGRRMLCGRLPLHIEAIHKGGIQ